MKGKSILVILIILGILINVSLEFNKLNSEVDKLSLNNDILENELINSNNSITKLNQEIDSLNTYNKSLLDKLNKLDLDKQETKVSRGSLKVHSDFIATAYCPCKKCCGKWSGGNTKSGTSPKEGRTISVDPKVIPLGSTVLVNGKKYIAEDVGGAINGKIIDIYFNTHQEALNWGRQNVKVEVIKN